MKTKTLQAIKEEMEVKQYLIDTVEGMLNSREWNINFCHENINKCNEMLSNEALTENEKRMYNQDLTIYTRMLQAEEKVKAYLLEMF